MSATQSFILLTTGFFLKFEFERHTLATSALPWPITTPPGHIVLYVLGALFMTSFFSKTIESRQFKKWLVGADSPLEFARQTIRLNGDVTNRSQSGWRRSIGSKTGGGSCSGGGDSNSSCCGGGGGSIHLRLRQKS